MHGVLGDICSAWFLDIIIYQLVLIATHLYNLLYTK